MKVTQALRELVFELVVAGYSTADIREMTGVSRQTQWRIRTKPDWVITPTTEKRMSKVALVESALGIDLRKPAKEELFDIVEKKAESKYYARYTEPVIRRTKILDREFKDISMTKKNFQDMNLQDLKDLVGNRIFYVNVTGEHKKGKIEEKIPFFYSSKGRLRPDEKDLRALRKFVQSHSKRSFGNYTSSKINTIVITTVEKM